MSIWIRYRVPETRRDRRTHETPPEAITGTRLSLDALLTRLSLVKNVFDIYVEGLTDQHFLRKRTRLMRYGVEVFTVDDLDLPAALLSDRERREGNKGRLLALARIVEEAIPDGSAPIAVVVDQDEWTVFSGRPDSRYLEMTDYSSMEMYCLDDESLQFVLEEFLRLATSPTELRMALLSPLRAGFFLRGFDKENGVRCGVPPLARSCNLRGAVAVVDQRALIGRYASRGGLTPAQRERALSQLSQFMPTPPLDFRSTVHFHDFVELLAWYANQNGVKDAIRRVEVIERVLQLWTPRCSTVTCPLVDRIDKRIDSATTP